MKRLVITEKPSMGRDVAAALGASQKREGYIEGQQVIVTWCVGHLVELDEPESYDPKYQKWRLEDLPIIPEKFKHHASKKTIDQFRAIKELLNRSDVTSVVNAADAGREGELIFDLVYKLARCKKPVERLWISSLTREAIIEGFQNLKPGGEYKGLMESAHARQQADWIVGMNASRAFSIKARGAGYEGVFSVGRVQTPTLALIVERDNEIAVFVPTVYYEVVALFEAESGSYRGVWHNAQGSRLQSKDAATAIADKVKGKPGRIDKVEKRSVRERPPLLYDLTALQRIANARFGYSAAKTLETAQSLYEKAFITYPRTSSRHLSSDVAKELREHIEAAKIGPYIPFIEEILSRGALKLTSRHTDDKKVTDHHAIIPTKQKINPSSLRVEEKRIYDLIVRRFLAAFYEDAELERTTIVTTVSEESFITRGTVVTRAGWRKVDPPRREESKASSEEEEGETAELPPVKAKEAVKTLEADALEKQTKAPPRYTDSSLLAAMETAGKLIDDEELRLAMKDGGLGTPATRAGIIETLIKREYVARERKSLKASAKGAALIKHLSFRLLKSPELTGMWEKKLSEIAHKEYAFESFMGKVKEMARAMVKQIAETDIEKTENDDSANERNTVRPDKALDCPKCAMENRSGFILERKGSMGKFWVCSTGKEKCGYISDAPKNAKQRKAMLESRCPNCGGAMRLRKPKEKDQTPILLCVNYANCRGILKFDKEDSLESNQAVETGPPCKVCGSPTVKRGPFSNGSYFWGCTKWRSDNAGCTASPVWIK